jgi:hypothetical protein
MGGQPLGNGEVLKGSFDVVDEFDKGIILGGEWVTRMENL